MCSANGCSTPMDTSIDLYGSKNVTDVPYREAIGSLMYLLVGTRPDLAYSIGVLSKFVECPTMVHWNAVKKLIRYIIQTKSASLKFNSSL